MKIKTIFLIANGSSILLMTTFLMISYFYMILSVEMIGWLSLLTLLSALVSFFVYYLLTSPVERSIKRLSDEAHEMTENNFGSRIPEEGPVEIRTLTKQFNQMSERLSLSFRAIKQAEQSRRELVANISHDLRTPMASIRAFLQAIQDGVVEDPKAKEQYMRTISLEVERLDHMIQQLFELSVYDSGQMKLHKEWVALDQWLIEVMEHKRFILEEQHRDVHIELPDRVKEVYMDRDKIKRVLMNLLDNALRHSETHTDITIRIKQPNDQVLIEVEDHGEGIDEKHLPFIFNRTYRVEASRNQKYAGTGLGLAIAKHIVEAHDGEISVQSKPGAGSTFIVRLPLKGRSDESG
ncbi:HAMP domain-containing histidine kinase [Halobacillus salinarum]|uniref:histidine kinase n=1 Tax=Halobacillus salinarum TaxID=2932257 RepID=A0ABY4EJ30_9BACI|nr:HAMP domain-containing sensor histidine kinase [Halobacillus salinarum]UOQ44483.1 HAMP domain-containing histidine kinase [Halobacillus salinarum]